MEKLLQKIRKGPVFVEGKKDREALEALGVKNILTISGNLRLSCRKLKNAERVFVLTDLDRRGDELAVKARDELEALSVKADLETRKLLAHTLRIRFFEEAERAYKELIEEGEKNG
ncbi:hypothetical protein GF318_02995 [Candidatus Micrarchaeota archaeon]|nr:hypothetical protein [Candidatus Micrarchaeota archaeon]